MSKPMMIVYTTILLMILLNIFQFIAILLLVGIAFAHWKFTGSMPLSEMKVLGVAYVLNLIKDNIRLMSEFNKKKAEEQDNEA